MIIHLFAPFFTGSHRRWAEEYVQRSAHTIRLFTLPGYHWKWRMHGAAVELAQAFLQEKEQPDLLLTTDMLDTATFLSLTRHRTYHLPVAVYFHENQLTYPWSPTDEDVVQKRDRHYGWLNYTSALVADTVLFNSAYHQRSFLTALPDFLRAFPDYQGLANATAIADKSHVLPLGMSFGDHQPVQLHSTGDAPILLWNHRWEYDKNPAAFFRVCGQLKKEGYAFRLVVLGEQYTQVPAVFKRAQQHLREEIIHWGFAQDRVEYLAWLDQASFLPVTSHQDFFGGSIVEAMYRGVHPLLPNRLAYPEHIPSEWRSEHLYNQEEELLQKLRQLLSSNIYGRSEKYRQWVAHYDWVEQAPTYDQLFTDLVNKHST